MLLERIHNGCLLSIHGIPQSFSLWPAIYYSSVKVIPLLKDKSKKKKSNHIMN